MDKQDLIHMIGREMSQSRIGSKDVFMDGKHLPRPSELERARQLYEDLDFAIREQIAREIEARHEIKKAAAVLDLVDRTFNPCYQGVCCCAEDSAIARGEK